MCLKHKCPLIMAYSKDGPDHKNIYFDISRKILSQEMIMCNIHVKYQSSKILFKIYYQCKSFQNNRSNTKLKVRFIMLVPTESSCLIEYSCEILEL